MSNKNESLNYPFDKTNDYDNDNNAKFIFIADSIEKKRIAKLSIISKKNRLPTNKEAKQKSGRVIMSYLYEDIMNFNCFKDLPKDVKRTALIIYLNKHKAVGIAKNWGKTLACVYSTQARLNIKRDLKGKYITDERTVPINDFKSLIANNDKQFVDFKHKNLIPSFDTVKTKGFDDVIADMPTNIEPITQPEPKIEPMIEQEIEAIEDEIKVEYILETEQETNDRINTEQHSLSTDCTEMYGLSIILHSKLIAGEHIPSFMSNMLVLFDNDSTINISLSITKYSGSKYTSFGVNVDNNRFTIDNFKAEFQDIFNSIPKNDMYELTMNINEIRLPS